jgi:transcriptional regulator with XRE-family HTH domain
MSVIREARRERMTQVQLAEALGVPQVYVSRWETSRVPTNGQVGKIEKALGLPAGTLLRRAGYIADGVDVRAAVMADPNLTPDYRDIVLNTYDMAVKNSAAAQSKGKRLGSGSSIPSTKTPKVVRRSRTKES